MRRLLIAVVAALSIAGLAVPAAASAITVGVGDNGTVFFTNKDFKNTRIGNARLLVGWNAIDVGWQREQLDAWLGAARAAGVTPLITFGKSRSNPNNIPTTQQYAAAFKRFRARYPWVKEFSTWNEANACGERTCKRAKQVAAWWRQIRLACPGCTVLAAELVDAPNITSWVKEFRHYATSPPTRWGLHNYLDANRFATTYTRQMLSAIGSGAKLWLTETGGLVDRNNGSSTKIPEGFQHAADATNFLFGDIRRLSGNIQRIYFYDWVAPKRPYTWDSAFVSTAFKPRPAYTVLRRWLSKLNGAGLLNGRLKPPS